MVLQWHVMLTLASRKDCQMNLGINQRYENWTSASLKVCELNVNITKQLGTEPWPH
jgi:hypothetical protein